MDAWETLIDNSSLTPPGFDAWEHLNAQEGGGTGGTLVLADGLDLEVDTMEYELSLETTEYEVEVESEYEVEIEETEMVIEVC